MKHDEILANAKASLAALNEKRLAAAVGGVTAPASTSKSMPEMAVKKLRSFNVKSFDELMDVNTSDRKFGFMPKSELQNVKALKEAVDTAVLLSNIFKKPVTELKFWQDELSFQLKAFGIDSGDEGFNWIPTAVSTSYIDEYNLDLKVVELFTAIKMPSNPYKFPVLSNGAISRKVGEVTALSPAQVFKTDKTIMLDSVKMTSLYALPEELNEDSAVDMIRVIRQELMEGMGKGMEIAILEGDTAGTMHHFSQLPDVVAGTLVAAVTDSPEFYFDGLRKRALAAAALACVDAGGNAVTEAEMSAARGKMGKFGIDPKAVCIIPGVKSYLQLLQLDDVRTLEQFGPQATILTGQLASYEGCAVVPSEWLREDTAAAGKNTATVGNNVKGSILFVNRKRFFVGERRGIQVLVEKNRTQYDVLDMVAFARKAFQGVLKADATNYASESSVALIYNIGF